MTHSIIEITSIDNQPLQIEKDEIEEERKVNHLIDIKKGIDKMFKDLENSSIKSFTIFKVKVGLRESNPAAYTSKMVSIGPYHKKNHQLHRMEKYKLLYLRRFLQRKEGLDVESCLNELEELKEEAIKCYDYDDLKDLGNDIQFCQMLLLDGCFVVEFIREFSKKGEEISQEEKIINFDDSIIFRDLMLLENQLPFFVLNKLHHMTQQHDEYPLALLVNNSFTFLVDLPEMTLESFKERKCNEDIKHLLHAVHAVHTFTCHDQNPKKISNDDRKCLKIMSNIKQLLHAVHIFSWHGQNPKEMSNDDKKRLKLMPNATELSEAGVSFVKQDKKASLFDRINFKNGLMTIPCFKVDDETETLLRNFIAYEQQSYDVQPIYFSDFAIFMDQLIDSDKDVNLLRQKGIIEHLMGEDKEVASLFNKIGNGVTVYSNFYYNKEFEKAAEHCKKPWNKMKANLMHNYFSSPWAGASTVAAIILLILTTIQTILAFTGSIK